MLAKKREIWARGLFTHSDSHYLAAEILSHPLHGPRVAETIAKRFPYVLIDELQDTGWYLARALLQLLQQPGLKALVVGDPNQAIYEFTGADPAVFEQFVGLPDATEMPITVSQRCSQVVSNLASSLKHSGQDTVAKAGAPQGYARLRTHSHPRVQQDERIADLVTQLAEDGDSVALLVRRENTAVVVSGRQPRRQDVPVSGDARRLTTAAALLLEGDQSKALSIVTFVLEKLALSGMRATLAVLQDAGLSPITWRRALFHIFAALALSPDKQTWGQWNLQLRTATSEAIALLGPSFIPTNVQLGNAFRCSGKDAGKERGQLSSARIQQADWAAANRVDHIHKVKGEEFDHVVIYTPKPTVQQPCPSESWWNEPEERRVAFVAVSRARLGVTLIVHEETLASFQVLRPEFLAEFDEGGPL